MGKNMRIFCKISKTDLPRATIILCYSCFFRNVTETDLGRYTLEYFNLNLVKRKNVTLELEINILMNNQIKVFVIMIALLLLLLMVMIVCILRKDDLKWFWKKYFGAYEIGTLNI